MLVREVLISAGWRVLIAKANAVAAERINEDPSMANRIKALAPDRPWYRHNDSSIQRISAYDVFGEEAQRTVYIFVLTLREES